MSLKQTIQINDQFTKPLQDMANALNMTISHFEKLQEVSSHPVDTAGLKYAREQLADVDLSIKQMADNINIANGEQEKFNSTLNKTNISVKNVAKHIIGWGTAIKLARGLLGKTKDYLAYDEVASELQAVSGATNHQMDIMKAKAKDLGSTGYHSADEVLDAMIRLNKGGMNLLDTFNAVESSLNLSKIGGLSSDSGATIMTDTLKGFRMESDEANNVLDAMAYTANKTTTDIGDIGTAFRDSASSARRFGADVYDTSAMIGMMSNTFKGGKAGKALRAGFGRLASPAKEAQKWLQLMGTTTLDPVTNDLKNVYDLTNDLSEGFSKLNKQQQMSAGKAIFGEQYYAGWLDILERGQDALKKTASQIEEDSKGYAESFMETLTTSLSGKWEVFKNAFHSQWMEMFDRVKEDSGLSEAFDTIFENLLTINAYVLTAVEILIPILAELFTFITSNMDIIILGMLLYLSIKAMIIAFEYLHIGATMGLAGAHMLLAGGVLAVVGAMLGFVAILGLGITLTNRLGITNMSVIGAIGGAFSWLGAVVKNIFIAMHNIIMRVFVAINNTADKVTTGIHNAFIRAGNGMQEAMTSAGVAVMNILAKITGALDKVFNTGLTDWVEGAKKSIIEWGNAKILEESEGNQLDVEDYLLDYNDLGDAWSSGYNKGAKFEKGITDKFNGYLDSFNPEDLLGGGGLNPFDYNNNGFGGGTPSLGGAGLPGGAGDKLGKIAKDTGKIAKAVDVKEDDLKYLKDLAEARILNKYSDANIKIEINNDNNIGSDMDLDGVVNDMASGIEDAVYSVMEGV